MPVPSTIADLSATESSNSPAGSEPIGIALDNYIRAHAAIIRQVSDDTTTSLSAKSNASDLSASSGASLVGFVQSGAGATARTVQAKLRDSVSVKDFGAVGDSVTDDTAAIQAAIDSGAKRITGTSGSTYKITNTLTVNADSIVIDLRKSTINLDDATGLKSHIKIGDNATQRNGIEIRNVTFTRTQAATAGAAIDAQYVGVLKIRGCRIYGNSKIYNGISVSRGMILGIESNYIENCVSNGIYLVGTGSGVNRTVDASIRENRIEGGLIGLKTWDFVEGVFCRDNIFFNQTTTCASVSASSNANGLVSFKFQENDFDTSAGVGLYLEMVSNVQVTDNWFSSIAGTSLQIKDTVDSVIVSDNQIYPLADGIEIGGNAVRADSNHISGGAKCINVKSTATNTSITNKTLSNSQHGLYLAENPVGVHITGNNIYGTSVGTISDHATPNARTIQNNQGDSVLGSTTFITVGASPYAYTSGNRPEMVSIFGGTVSNIQIGGNSIGFTSNRTVIVPPRSTITVTYSSIPFMTKMAF